MTTPLPQPPSPPPPPPSTTMEPDKANEDEVLGWLLMEQCWSECREQHLEDPAVRFIQDPYSSLLLFQSSSSYITINGNEETCGSSFADSGTSFMAALHSTTTTPTNFNAEHDENDGEELLSTFLGLQRPQRHDEQHLLPPNLSQL